jgi:hypothetical protein
MGLDSVVSQQGFVVVVLLSVFSISGT